MDYNGIIKTLSRTQKNYFANAKNNKCICENSFVFEKPDAELSYKNIEDQYIPSVLNVRIKYEYLKYYKAVCLADKSNSTEFNTLFEAISISLFGSMEKSNKLKLKCIKYILEAQLNDADKDTFIRQITKDQIENNFQDLLNLISEALEIKLAVWGLCGFDGNVAMFGNSKQYGAAGVVFVNNKCSAVVKCNELSLESADSIITNNEKVIQSERQEKVFINPDVVKTSNIEAFAGEFTEILPIQITEEELKDPLKYFFKYRDVLKKYGMVLGRPDKRVWEKCKPTLKNLDELEEMEFQEQVFEYVEDAKYIATVVHQEGVKNKKVKDFMQEDVNERFDYTRPIFNPQNVEPNVYYRITEDFHIIESFNGGFNPNNIKCDALDNAFKYQIVQGINGFYYYIGTKLSKFQIHREDHNFASLNILLAGCYKIWFILHRSQTQRLQDLIKARLEMSNYEGIKCANFIQHKDLFLDPQWLQQEGFDLYLVRQKPGDLVFTDYGALHFGFNAGLNVACAINLIDEEWITHYHTQPICTEKVCGIFKHGGKNVPTERIMKEDTLFRIFKFYDPETWNGHVKVPIKNVLPENLWLEMDVLHDDVNADEFENASVQPKPDELASSKTSKRQKRNRTASASDHQYEEENMSSVVERETQSDNETLTQRIKYKRNRESEYYTPVPGGSSKVKCKLCPLEAHRTTVIKHYKTVHQKIIPPPVICSKCSRTFDKPANLNRHLKTISCGYVEDENVEGGINRNEREGESDEGVDENHQH